MKLTEWNLTEDVFGNVQAHGYVTGHYRFSVLSHVGRDTSIHME